MAYRAPPTPRLRQAAAGVAGGAVAARGLYERARPALMHSKPGFVRGADAALATYDAVRGAIGR